MRRRRRIRRALGTGFGVLRSGMGRALFGIGQRFEHAASAVLARLGTNELRTMETQPETSRKPSTPSPNPPPGKAVAPAPQPAPQREVVPRDAAPVCDAADPSATADGARQRTPPEPSGLHRVRFEVQASTRWGETVCVIGNHPALGSWVPEGALALEPSAYPAWTGAVEVASGSTTTTLEYKYVIRAADGMLRWEAREANRTIAVSALATDQQIREAPRWPA
jgi:hypothetical protein